MHSHLLMAQDKATHHCCRRLKAGGRHSERHRLFKARARARRYINDFSGKSSRAVEKAHSSRCGFEAAVAARRRKGGRAHRETRHCSAVYGAVNVTITRYYFGNKSAGERGTLDDEAETGSEEMSVSPRRVRLLNGAFMGQ